MGLFTEGLQSSIFLDLTVGLTLIPRIPLSSQNGVCSQAFSIKGSLMGGSIFLVVLAEQIFGTTKSTMMMTLMTSPLSCN